MISDRVQRRDFFLQAGVLDHLNDSELVQRFRDVSDVCAARSLEESRALAQMLVAVPSYRSEFFAILRHAAWVIRMGRGCGSGQAMVEAKATFAEAVQLLALAGFDLVHVRQLVGCLTHECTCDGCDLVSGDRFDKIAPQVETPACVTSTPGAMAERIAIGAGGSYANSADQF